jgi:hypothetical protein
MNPIIKSSLIAPCGMNCALCLGYQREENKCPGCNEMDKGKPKYCRKCTIKNCKELKKSKKRFCLVCDKCPCKRLKQLDKRYRTKYNMSMIENLEFIKEKGIRKFIQKEKKKWKCSKCGKVICVHRDVCQYCKRNQ